MAWSDVRTAIKERLETVSIDTTILGTARAETVKRVYEFPPAAIVDTPCFVMLPVARSQEWGPSYSRLRTYTMTVQFMTRSELPDTGAALADAYSESVKDSFIGALRLGGIDDALNIVNGPNIDAPTLLDYAGEQFIGFEMTLTIRFSESLVGFAA